MSNQSLQPLGQSSQVALQPGAQEASVPAAQEASSCWGFSTISSCCSAIDDCSGNYLSAIARAVSNFVTRCWDAVIDYLRSFIEDESVQEEEGEEGIQGLQAGLAAQPLAPADVLAKWSQIQALAPGQPGFAQQGEEWIRDISRLPQNLQAQLSTNFLLESMAHPERVMRIFTLMVKESPANHAILQSIRDYRPVEEPKKSEEAPVEITRTREAFLARWKDRFKKPLVAPKEKTKPVEKDNYNKVCNEWFRDIMDGLPEEIGVKVTMLVQAGGLSKGNLNAVTQDGFEALLKSRVADPAIIKLIEDWKPAADTKLPVTTSADGAELYDS